MNHTKRYLIKTFLAVFRNVIIRPDARKAPCDLPASDQSEQPILQHIKPLVSEQASQDASALVQLTAFAGLRGRGRPRRR